MADKESLFALAMHDTARSKTVPLESLTRLVELERFLAEIVTRHSWTEAEIAQITEISGLLQLAGEAAAAGTIARMLDRCQKLYDKLGGASEPGR